MYIQLTLKLDSIGHVLDDQVFEDYSEISISRLISPMIEAEIGMILKRDLQGPGVTAFDVMNSCEAIFPVIEIIDSRIKDWKQKFRTLWRIMPVVGG